MAHLALAAALLLSAWNAPAAAKVNPGAAAKTNAPAARPDPAVPLELKPHIIPPSLFEIPKTPRDGRDPFFPDSTRPYGTVSVTRTNPQSGTVSLALKALAGPAEKRFATISAVGGTGGTRSLILAQGEEDEIVTPTVRIKIRCLEIKDDAVTVEVNGVQRELRLRSGF